MRKSIIAVNLLLWKKNYSLRLGKNQLITESRNIFVVSTQQYMKHRSIIKYFINHSFLFQKLSDRLLHEI
jgi:hypothetical protein